MVEQADDIIVAHLHAAVGGRLAHAVLVGAAVDVDIATHRIHLAETVFARLLATQPEDTGENPVAFRVQAPEFRGVEFPRRPAADKYRVGRAAIADSGANAVPAARGTLAVNAFPRTVAGGRDGDVHDDAACLDELQALFIDADAD